MQVAIYARVSTDQQAKAQSISTQVERLVAYVQEQGWELSSRHIFRDDGCSGAVLSRPGLDRLRQVVRAGEVERLVLTTPDRLARAYVHQVLLMQELEGSGCAVEFLDRPMSKDPNDQLLLQIRGAVAEYERTLIAQRTRQGKERKFDAGLLLPWSKAPYGYRVNPDRPADPAGVSIDETEAAMVREIFARYLAEEGTIGVLVRWLLDSGIASPQGKQGWQPTTVRGVLTNPTYTGIVYRQRFRRQDARVRQSPLQGPIGTEKSLHAQPQSEWRLVTRVPGIISEEVFEQVQAKLALNRERASRNNKAHDYLLRALVSCGSCLGACSCRTTAGGNAYYLCRSRADKVARARGEACRVPYVPAKELDALVWEDLCMVLMHPQCITHALERAHGGHWLPQELEGRRAMLRKAKASTERQTERLTDAYVGGILGIEEFGRRRGELKARIETLEQQERQLAREGEQQMELQGVATSITAFCQRVQAGMSGATFAQQRYLVELLIDRVVVTGNQVEIRYVVPTTPESENIRFCHLRTHHARGRTSLLPSVRMAGVRQPEHPISHRVLSRRPSSLI